MSSCVIVFQRKKEYEIEMNRFISVSLVFLYSFLYLLVSAVAVLVFSSLFLHIFLFSMNLSEFVRGGAAAGLV